MTVRTPSAAGRIPAAAGAAPRAHPARLASAVLLAGAVMLACWGRANATGSGGPDGVGRAAGAGGASWGKAIEVPGIASLNVGGDAAVTAISCSASGDCLAGGQYATRGNLSAGGFLVTEQDGHWGKAFKVPGTGNPRVLLASVATVSCSSPGNCAAGGTYIRGPRAGISGWLASEHDGRWSEAFDPVAKLDSGRFGAVQAVSCPANGNCTAGGRYAVAARRGTTSGVEAFVISQHDGTWGKAIEVPGIAALNTAGLAMVTSVSCASAGNCSAGGWSSLPHTSLAFVVTERHGTWGKALDIRAGKSNRLINSVSCSSAGNCAAGGYAAIAEDKWESFVVSERDGAWGRAIVIPGTVATSYDPGASEVTQVDCVRAGDCTAIGQDGNKAFIVTEHDGTWAAPVEVPVPAGGRVRSAVLSAISCTSPGDCAGGGRYTPKQGGKQVFVVSEHDGHWGTPAEVPGSAALNTRDDAAINALSCPAHGNCAAGGGYSVKDAVEAFVASQDG